MFIFMKNLDLAIQELINIKYPLSYELMYDDTFSHILCFIGTIDSVTGNLTMLNSYYVEF